ncbi:MAG TPA: bifunctional hydroxymethylpyrimidine kinase/phosphomethylpyrimidine kinase [Deltaproteobacteria bacterium]|nr:bifunctional hydroxymethylpyrimidine kinase/phosphomethylpyrimidine kinase [Deltaproteobacteria bacterium]
MINKPVKVLCIGGSDSGGGAGIQADLKAVHACGCYGMSVITALTAQNSIGVQGIFPVTAVFVRKQLSSVLEDIGADAVKTGMIWKLGVVGVVAEKIKEYKIKKLVVDPVMVAKGGSVLMEDSTTQALVKKLLPLALVVTPNIPEAEILAKMRIKSVRDMKMAAKVIFSLGLKNVVIKGGHLEKSKKTGSVDILYNGKEYHELHADWINTKNTHGTGCTFASVLAAGLGQGKDVLNAAQFAKIMVTKAIKNSVSLGKGHGTVNMFP